MLVFLTQMAQAQSFVVTIDPQLADQAGIDPSGAESSIHDAADGALKLGDQTAFLAQMANANAFVTKGMGVDYASNPQRFVFGASIGSAVNGVGPSFGHGDAALPEGGYSFQLSGMAGLNLGILAGEKSPLRHVVLSVNGLVLSKKLGPFDADMQNLGAHIQIKLTPRINGPVVEWGGLDFTTGYELSHYQLNLTQSIPVESDALRWDATGSMDLSTTTTSVPLEVSTNLRILVASVYAGGALDMRLAGDSTASVELGGDINTQLNGQDFTIGTVKASMSSTGYAAEMVPRIFVGAQLNLAPVKAYGQLNIGPQDKSFGGHIGIRFAI